MMLLLAIISFVLSSNVIAADISAGNDISYEDLKQLNVSCPPKDTCAEREPEVYPGITFSNTCSCHAECSSLGTCCIDSPHRGKSSAKQKCGAVNFPEKYFNKSSGFYMVQSCPEKSAWNHLCEGDFSKDGDVLKITPVTSLDTNTTYRNYYCFRCNEMTNNILYWDFTLVSGTNDPKPFAGSYNVRYNDVDNNWSVTADGENISTTLRLQFSIPREIRFPMIQCNPKVVSGCPDSWEDDIIRSKCDSYTGLLYNLFGPVYRNAHCALCNSQPLHELSCAEPKSAIVRRSAFSFAHLINANRSDVDLVAKNAKCADDEMWNPFAKKCQKFSCALPGYVFKDGKCIAP